MRKILSFSLWPRAVHISNFHSLFFSLASFSFALSKRFCFNFPGWSKKKLSNRGHTQFHRMKSAQRYPLIFFIIKKVIMIKIVWWRRDVDVVFARHLMILIKIVCHRQWYIPNNVANATPLFSIMMLSYFVFTAHSLFNQFKSMIIIKYHTKIWPQCASPARLFLQSLDCHRFFFFCFCFCCCIAAVQCFTPN